MTTYFLPLESVARIEALTVDPNMRDFWKWLRLNPKAYQMYLDACNEVVRQRKELEGER